MKAGALLPLLPAMARAGARLALTPLRVASIRDNLRAEAATNKAAAGR